MEYSTYGTQQHNTVKNHVVALRMTPQQKKALERLAARQRVTASEAMRRLIDGAIMMSGEGVSDAK